MSNTSLLKVDDFQASHEEWLQQYPVMHGASTKLVSVGLQARVIVHENEREKSNAHSTEVGPKLSLISFPSQPRNTLRGEAFSRSSSR